MKHKIEEGYYTIKDASAVSGLKEDSIMVSCIKTKGRGLSYVDKNGEWMIHSSAIESLSIFFGAVKDLNPITKK